MFTIPIHTHNPLWISFGQVTACGINVASVSESGYKANFQEYYPMAVKAVIPDRTIAVPEQCKCLFLLYYPCS